MSCYSWRSRVMELARGGLPGTEERNRVTAHVSECRSCRIFLEEQIALTAAVTELAARTSMAPPADLESVLLAEFDLARARRRRNLMPTAAAGAIAAAVACFAVLHAPPQPRLEPVVPLIVPLAVPLKEIAASAPTAVVPAPKHVRRKSVPNPADDAGPFVAIPYIVPLDPRERVTVMRVEMPVAALMAVGLTTADPDPSARAQADVVVGEDGRIHAIRLVSFYRPVFSSERSIN